MVAYPRLLNLGEDVEERLKSHLDIILTHHEPERTEFLRRLERWQKDYWAEPNDKVRTFPFKNAANLIIPLAAITFETVHARSMTSAFGLKQTVSATARNPQWADFASPVGNFLDYELSRNKFKNRIESAIIELEKFGTGIGKVRYETITKYGVQDIGGEEQEFPVVTQHGCIVDSVPLSRFLMPYTALDIQLSPWVGEEHSRHEYEVKLMEQAGLFEEGTHEKLNAYYETVSQNAGIRFTTTQEELEKRKHSVLPSKIDFYEFWLSFDTDDSGFDKEIHVFYHHGARQLMGVRYNWNSDLSRPYRTAVYFPVEHRWTGVGICKQVEIFQREITTQHRQRLDNATLANMRMIKISKMSGYGPDEPVFPGKMWLLDDMTHVDTVQMGEIYPSSSNNEFQTLQYAQQRTGVNEVILGMPSGGTPGTATDTLSKIQEGNKKFDYAFKNIKSFVTDLITDVAVCIQQYGPKNLEYFTEAENGQMVQQWLSLPPDNIRQGLTIDLASAGQQENKLIDRQNWTQIAGMITQYYTGMMQLAQLMGNPQLAQLISMSGLQASTEAMKQILDSYDMKNIDRIIVEEFLNGGQLAALSNGGGGQGAIPSQVGGGLAPTQ